MGRGEPGVQVRVCQLPPKKWRATFFGRGVGGGGESDDGGDEGDRQGGHHPPADVEEAECGDHQPLLQLHPCQHWPPCQVPIGHLQHQQNVLLQQGYCLRPWSLYFKYKTVCIATKIECN